MKGHSYINFFNLLETVNLKLKRPMFVIKGYLDDKIVISIDQLYLIFSDKRIFPRRRIDSYVKAIAVKSYILRLSLAQVALLYILQNIPFHSYFYKKHVKIYIFYYPLSCNIIEELSKGSKSFKANNFNT